MHRHHVTIDTRQARTTSVLNRSTRPRVVRCAHCGATDSMLIFDLDHLDRARCAATEPCLSGTKAGLNTPVCPSWCVTDHDDVDATDRHGWNHFSREHTMVIRNGTDIHEVTMGIMAWQHLGGEFEPAEVYLTSPAMEMYLAPSQAAAFADQLGALARLAAPAPPTGAAPRPLAHTA